MSDDRVWSTPPRSKKQVVDEEMSRLQFGKAHEARARRDVGDITDAEREAFAKRSMDLFADDFVVVQGAPYPLTKTLARQLGFDVDRLPGAGPSYDIGDAESRPD